MYILYTNIGDAVYLLDHNGRKVGAGEVARQTVLHGRELKEGWTALMVLDVVPGLKAHDEFPTHSGLVENKSFIAWPQKSVVRKA